MNIQLLGPVEATFDDRPVALGATKQRAVLAILALRANATVSIDDLVDGLWGDDPPTTAPKMVQLYVSQLRRLLAGADAEIVTHGRGYELRMPSEAVDAVRFERLVEDAGGANGAPNDTADQALALWQGAALADVADEPFAGVEIRRLEDLRLRATELAVDADLAAGREQQALSRLERLIEQHPLRERLHAQRMLALYRSGRQAEALDAYVAARRRLVDDIGVEPGAELRELHERVLRQDPELRLAAPPREVASAPRPPADPARERTTHGRALVLAAAAAILLGGGVFAFTRLTGADRLSRIDDGAIGVIDAETGAIRAQTPIGFEPAAVAAGDGSVWVANPEAGTVARVYKGGKRVDTIDVGPNPVGLAFGAGSLWVAGGDDGAVAQVPPSANRAVQRIPVGNGLRALAVGYGAVWAATTLDGEVVRLDLRSGRVAKRIPVAGHPVAVATGAGAVWVAAEDSNSVVRIDPRSDKVVQRIGVGNGPSAVAVGLGAVWVANRQDGTVSRIDPGRDRVSNTGPAGHDPVALSIADGGVWIADAAGAVLRFDPHTNSIVQTVRIGSRAADLATLGGAVWTAVVAPPTAHRGGTLRVGQPTIELDPGWAAYDGFSTPMLMIAYDGLLAYRRAPGVAGARLVGDLAVGVPEAADAGRSYTFQLRRGLRFSDGRPVRPSDFRASMERMLVMPSGIPPLYNAIEGAAHCRTAPKRCDLSRGIATDDRVGTITLHLRRPDPDLLKNLTIELAAIVPSATPREAVLSRPIPGTGPYRVQRIVRGRSALLERNPYFRARDGRPAGFADRIAITMNNDERSLTAALERGQLDYAPIFQSSAKELAALRTRVGARLQSASLAQTGFAFLNVHTPPFDDVRVRRALNLAVDRARVVEETGGADASSPTCQLLPPGLGGYQPICPFTVAPSPAGAWVAPDLAQARRLVAASGTRGRSVDVWTPVQAATPAREVARTLRELGFHSRARIFHGPFWDGHLPPQIGMAGWVADFPEPAAFLRELVGCNSYHRGDISSTNLGGFCDPSIDTAIDRAQAAGAAAGDAWRRIELRIAAQAPVVPLHNLRLVAVVSKRAGNVQFSPLTSAFFEQIWVR
jgi:YVTN family beta-propeller protein